MIFAARSTVLIRSMRRVCSLLRCSLPPLTVRSSAPVLPPKQATGVAVDRIQVKQAPPSEPRPAAPAQPPTDVEEIRAGCDQFEPVGDRGVGLLDGLIGEGVGEIYVAKFFPPENKAKMDALEEHAASAGDINALEGKVNTVMAKVEAVEKAADRTEQGVQRIENFFIQKGMER